MFFVTVVVKLMVLRMVEMVGVGVIRMLRTSLWSPTCNRAPRSLCTLLSARSSFKTARLFKVPGVLQLFEHIYRSVRLLCLLALLDQLLLQQTILCLQSLTFTSVQLVS
jgi:hypothetical protein